MSNPPGLSALAYRVETHAGFLRRMLARLHTQAVPTVAGTATQPLAALTTREQDDPAIALLDAWATVADVLTFYQERIANEGYLRTAVERRSVLELARAIGYELRPGVAAAAFLAFTVEDASGAPGVATVPAGTRVQSIPGQGQLPQTFETSLALTARAEWNALRPRLNEPQAVTLDAQALYLAGATSNLKTGDLLLLAAHPAGSLQTRLVRVSTVTVDAAAQRTRVDVVAMPASSAAVPTSAARAPTAATGAAGTATAGSPPAAAASPPSSAVQTAAPLAVAPAAPADSPSAVASPPTEVGGVFVFGSRLGCFGNNAPRYAALHAPPVTGQSVAAPTSPDANDWDANPRSIWVDSVGRTYLDADLFLERSLPQIDGTSWIVLESPALPATPYRLAAAADISLADYGLSARVTGLTLFRPDGHTPPDKTVNFPVRKTTAYVQSARLELGQLPLEAPVTAGSRELLLDRLAPGLEPGRPLILSGERLDTPGVQGSEIVILRDCLEQEGGETALLFQAGLQFGYRRQTLTVNANVAPATHGATIAGEVLGSGDGAAINQRFSLKRPPLTYLSAATPSGERSTLSVMVDGVFWQEAPDLYALDPGSRSYTVRQEDDAAAGVLFGDGEHGARLPSGTENVIATYRSGSGPDGNVAAGALSLLQTRPLGIRSVTNPLPAAGAAPPEQRDSARIHAPLTVLTLDRIVSRQDVEDFANAFPGIGQAQAATLWAGAGPLLHLTVADAAGGPVAPTSALYANLLGAIRAAGNPLQRLQIDSYDPLLFNLEASLLVGSAYAPAAVITDVQATLAAAFAFGRRAFGQGVTASDLIATIQVVPGVLAVDLTTFYLAGTAPTLAASLAAGSAYVARDDQVQLRIHPAQLLLINVPGGVTIREMRP